MDYDKLIERLKNNRHPNGLKSQAATAISALQDENEKLRAELEQVKNERDSAKATLQWLKLHGQKED